MDHQGSSRALFLVRFLQIKWYHPISSTVWQHLSSLCMHIPFDQGDISPCMFPHVEWCSTRSIHHDIICNSKTLETTNNFEYDLIGGCWPGKDRGGLIIRGSSCVISLMSIFEFSCLGLSWTQDWRQDLSGSCHQSDLGNATTLRMGQVPSVLKGWGGGWLFRFFPLSPSSALVVLFMPFRNSGFSISEMSRGECSQLQCFFFSFWLALGVSKI